MIYFFSGGDREKRARDVSKLCTTLAEQYPNQLLLSRNDSDLELEELEGFLEGQSLFQETLVVVLSGTLAGVSVRTFLEKDVARFANSVHHFIFVDEEIPVDSVEALQLHAKIFTISQLPKKLAAPYNPFALSDAFGKRDKKGAWLLYREALSHGSDPREIHGMLFWIVKAMILAKPDDVSADASGLSPFVFKKAKVFARNFSLSELTALSGALVATHHEGMRQGTDLEADLETFILKSL